MIIILIIVTKAARREGRSNGEVEEQQMDLKIRIAFFCTGMVKAHNPKR